jgi:hypothetical protein
MMKKILVNVLIVAVLVVVAAGLFWFVKSNQPTMSSAPVITQNQPGALSAQEKTYSENEKKTNMEIAIRYPEFSGLPNTDAQAKINADIKTKTFASLTSFKGEVSSCASTPDNPGQEDNPCLFQTDYGDAVIVNNTIFSVPLQQSTYTQGAHGSTLLWFANYDINTGQMIGPQDIFQNGSNYLKVIADYSKQQLITQLNINSPDSMSDADWVSQGTAPDSDNYNNNIGFEKDGLVVVFEEYQVAAFAAGPQTVHIPYSVLKDVLDPKGLLGQWAAKPE